MTVFSPAWLYPPADVGLPRDEVHVWQAALDPPRVVIQRLIQTLSPEERARAARFCFERDRLRFVVGRGVLRVILGRYLGAAPGEVRFGYGPRGKPTLAGEQNDIELRFNLSHSYEFALYAIARERKIGVDIERVHPIDDFEQIAGRYFSVYENAALRALPPDERLVAFFSVWTCKEAYLKATGDGLAKALSEFAVSLAPLKPVQLLWVKGDPHETARWSLRTLTPVVGYRAALAVEGHDWYLTCWHWPESC